MDFTRFRPGIVALVPDKGFSRQERDAIALFDLPALLYADERTKWPRPVGVLKTRKAIFWDMLIAPPHHDVHGTDSIGRIRERMEILSVRILRQLCECWISSALTYHAYPLGFGGRCEIRAELHYVPICMLESPIFEALRRNNEQMLKEAITPHNCNTPFVQLNAQDIRDAPLLTETPAQYAIRRRHILLLTRVLRAGASITWNETEFQGLEWSVRKCVAKEWDRRVRLNSAALLGVGKHRRAHRHMFGLLARELLPNRSRYFDWGSFSNRRKKT